MYMHMATQASDPRSSRVVVLVSPAEKRRIAANAAAVDMTMSDFMRTAAERYTEPNEAEKLLMRDLIVQLEAANQRTDEAFAALKATRNRAEVFDEEAYRAKVREELLARTDIDWRALGELLATASTN
jgi:hypothetical protein